MPRGGNAAEDVGATAIAYPPGCKPLSDELNKDELIRRLKNLAKAFQEMGQDEQSQFSALALHLSSELFLDHPNKDVRLLVACCIADIFRIFAPEAPYQEADLLKTIFIFLTRQLSGLQYPEAPSFKRYFYLLENLAWVKSFNICLELDDHHEIFTMLYKGLFSIISDKHEGRVTEFMLDVMVPLIVEADTVSQELLDIILINILEPHKTQNRQAYRLASELIKRSSCHLEPAIQTFFNNALMLGKTSESDVSNRLYDIILEINIIYPALLLTVLPQLEFKLRSNCENDRKAVTKLLAKMFSEDQSTLAQQHRMLWMCFLGRFNDIDTSIRRICVQHSSDFLYYHPNLTGDLTDPLQKRQHDADENVRLDVILAIVSAAKKNVALVPDELLQCVKERTLDKKLKIRKEALSGLGLIHRMVVQTGKLEQITRTRWISNKILHSYYQQGIEDKVMVERIVNMSLVPYTLEPEQRAKRLYMLYGHLDCHAQKALEEMFRTQTVLRGHLRSLLELHQRPPSEASNKLMIVRLGQLSKMLTEPVKAMEHLKKLNKLIQEDKKLCTCLLKLVSPTITCKRAEECVREILKKTGNPIPQNYLWVHVKSLLERVAPLMIDALTVKALLGFIEDAVAKVGDIPDEVPDAIDRGLQLLIVLSSSFVGAFQTEEIFAQLLTLLKEDDDVVSDGLLQVFTAIGQRVESNFPDVYANLLPLLQKFVKIGNPKQVKHSIRCIDKICSKKTALLGQLFEHLQGNMNVDSANFLSSMVAIGHMMHICPGEFVAPIGSIVSKVIVKQLLMQDRGSESSSLEPWCADHLVSEETQQKIQGMKLISRWLLGAKTVEPKFVMSTLRLLGAIVCNSGDLMERGMINPAEKSRLRLQAASSIIYLSQESTYNQLIPLEIFQKVAFMINDPVLEVRMRLSAKLNKLLLKMKITTQYLSIFALSASDPSREHRNIVRKYIHANISKRREYVKHHPEQAHLFKHFLPDYVLPFLVHLLAHDDDLQDNNDVDTLKCIKESLWFLMEPLIMRNDQYSYSFYRRMIEDIKNCRDRQNPDCALTNSKLYAVCDLALILIITRTSNYLKDFPAQPALPNRLFTEPDPNTNTQNTKNYLPPELSYTNVKNKKAVMYPGQSPMARLTRPEQLGRVNGDETSRIETSRNVSPDSTSSSRGSTKGRLSGGKLELDDRISEEDCSDDEITCRPTKRGRVPPKGKAYEASDDESNDDPSYLPDFPSAPTLSGSVPAEQAIMLGRNQIIPRYKKKFDGDDPEEGEMDAKELSEKTPSPKRMPYVRATLSELASRKSNESKKKSPPAAAKVTGKKGRTRKKPDKKPMAEEESEVDNRSDHNDEAGEDDSSAEDEGKKITKRSNSVDKKNSSQSSVKRGRGRPKKGTTVLAGKKNAQTANSAGKSSKQDAVAQKQMDKKDKPQTIVEPPAKLTESSSPEKPKRKSAIRGQGIITDFVKSMRRTGSSEAKSPSQSPAKKSSRDKRKLEQSEESEENLPPKKAAISKRGRTRTR